MKILFYLLFKYLNEHFFFRTNSKIGDLKVDLITRQNKLNKVAKFMEAKSINTKLKQP